MRFVQKVHCFVCFGLTVRGFFFCSSFFSTFGGNNVACAVGLAVLQVMREENVLENARVMGAYFKKGLEELKEVKKRKILAIC